MKHLLGGVAIAALITTGAPAWAQNSHVSQSKQSPQAQTQSGMSSTGAAAANPAGAEHAQSGATMPSDSGKRGGKAAAGTQAKRQHGGTAPEDNMAEELNRQELQQVMQNSGQNVGSGQTQAPAGGPSGASGATSSGTGGGSR